MIKPLLNALLNLFYPKVCLACKNPLLENEELVCHHCLSDLPLTNIAFSNQNSVFNTLIPIVSIENATSLLYFNKGGIVKELIHQLKYKNHPEIGKLLAKLTNISPELYQNMSQIDIIVPVPLHPKKYKKRGYNQLTEFTKTLGKKYKIKTTEDLLLRSINTETQTKKNKEQRRKNVAKAFTVKNPEAYTGKHFLLVDDVMTTGATLEACTETILNEIENAKVSILTMAIVI